MREKGGRREGDKRETRGRQEGEKKETEKHDTKQTVGGQEGDRREIEQGLSRYQISCTREPSRRLVVITLIHDARGRQKKPVANTHRPVAKKKWPVAKQGWF